MRKFIIKTDAMYRDPRIERRIIESNRDGVLYGVLLVGLVMLLVVVMW